MILGWDFLQPASMECCLISNYVFNKRTPSSTLMRCGSLGVTGEQAMQPRNKRTAVMTASMFLARGWQMVLKHLELLKTTLLTKLLGSQNWKLQTSFCIIAIVLVATHDQIAWPAGSGPAQD